MYPPGPEFARPDPQRRTGVTCYRHKYHITYIGPNGAIEIAKLDGTILFRKAGADGGYL